MIDGVAGFACYFYIFNHTHLGGSGLCHHPNAPHSKTHSPVCVCVCVCGDLVASRGSDTSLTFKRVGWDPTPFDASLMKPERESSQPSIIRPFWNSLFLHGRSGVQHPFACVTPRVSKRGLEASDPRHPEPLAAPSLN